VLHHLGEAAVVFDNEDAVDHRRILTAMPALPEAPPLP
jgi:citrate lyase beta subunit